MKTEKSSQMFDYGPGALVVLVASIGFAVLFYSLNFFPFDFFNFSAWVFCPLGVYTIVYAMLTRRDSIYYLVWGAIMLALGAVSASYKIINPFVVLGMLLIAIAIIGIVAHQRSKS